MKKLVTFFLVIAMIFAMSIPAFAADATLKINDSTGKKYVGYQLLTLSISLKAGDTCPEDAGHVDACYNYAYSVNSKYLNILKEEVFNNGGNYLWGNTKPDSADKITEVQIKDYFKNQTKQDGTMRQVADRLYRSIQSATDIAPDRDDLQVGDNTVAQGYWLFADTTNLTNKNEANSLVIIDTMGEGTLTISPKTALPTIEKKVKDIEDSEDGDISDNEWVDSADHDFGDKVQFKLTSTVPTNIASYKKYKMIFHDEMAAGLTVDANSIKVYMYETKHKADVDTDLNDFMYDVTGKFVAKTDGLADDCTFEVGCEDIYVIANDENIPDDVIKTGVTFVVFYEAELNENAVIGAAGNENKVYLEYSNDAYGTTTGKTEVDIVKVFTYKLVINKVDSNGNALPGVKFKLYKKNVHSEAADLYDLVGAELEGVLDGEGNVKLVWEGIDDGDYCLEESFTPAGYNGMGKVYFSISAEHDKTKDEPQLTALDGGLLGEGDVATGTIEEEVVNHTGAILPETGAIGTIWLIFGGTMLIILSAVFMITRKKMSVYED